ncbi:4-(cytidine 5'-diphospho)-2-C-methyl-D-erythritol kinase [Planctomycetota bacterium]
MRKLEHRTQSPERKRRVIKMTHKEQFVKRGDQLLVRAPAKINLTLLIAGKRPDGFHEIETIMAKINFYDEILIEPGAKTGIELICTGPHWAPDGPDNLVYKASDLLLKTYNTKADLKITLTKNIPAGSGLGSASSDAAATLIGVSKFMNLPIDESPDNPMEQKLYPLAAQLGSDVNFFLGGPVALCTGKGEKIQKIQKFFNFLAILAMPDINVSTKKVYDGYNDNADLYQSLKCKINHFLEKNNIELAAKMCANMLEESCYELYGQLKGLKQNIKKLDIGDWCLSGSGSTMFTLLNSGDEKRAKLYKKMIETKVGCKSIIVSNNRW